MLLKSIKKLAGLPEEGWAGWLKSSLAEEREHFQRLMRKLIIRLLIFYFASQKHASWELFRQD